MGIFQSHCVCCDPETSVMKLGALHAKMEIMFSPLLCKLIFRFMYLNDSVFCRSSLNLYKKCCYDLPFTLGLATRWRWWWRRTSLVCWLPGLFVWSKLGNEAIYISTVILVGFCFCFFMPPCIISVDVLPKTPHDNEENWCQGVMLNILHFSTIFFQVLWMVKTISNMKKKEFCHIKIIGSSSTEFSTLHP